MYSISKTHILDIAKIKDVWERLSSGNEMTYFQKYEWYEHFASITPLNSVVDAHYWIIYDENKPVMIAPLWILKSDYHIVNRKRVRIIGNHGYTDYINLIYRNFDPAAFDFLYDSVRNEYGPLNWYFHDIKQNCSLYVHLKSKYTDKLQEAESHICPVLTLPETFDEYQKILSKGTRQNLRTAKNRAIKDGIELKFNFDDSEISREDCQKIRERRNEQRKDAKDKTSRNFDIKSLIYKYIVSPLTIRFKSFNPLTDDLNSRIISVRDVNSNRILAFFNIGYDNDRREIVVMTAGVDPDFFRYSPGLLLMYEFICQLIKNGDIERIDFTRGDEPYKLQLGSSQTQNSNLIIREQ